MTTYLRPSNPVSLTTYGSSVSALMSANTRDVMLDTVTLTRDELVGRTTLVITSSITAK